MHYSEELYKRTSDYNCKKSGPISCPNSYVKKACYMLDTDHDVVQFSFRTTKYRFWHPEESRSLINFYDFTVRLKTGQKLVHTVPQGWLDDDVMVARIEGMEMTADELGIPFELWTEHRLFGTNEEYREAIIRMLC